MHLKPSPLPALSLFLSFWLPLTAQADPTVQVAGIQVITQSYVAKEDPAEKEKSEFMRTLSVLNSKPGTKLALLVTDPDGFILGLDQGATELTKWTDDQGTEFKEEPSKERGHSIQYGINTFPHISKDKHATVIEIGASQFPTPTAQHLLAQGTLALKVAQGSKTESTDQVVSIKKGDSFKVGDVTYKVTQAQKPKWGDSPWMLELKFNGDPEAFAGFSFTDENGKTIAARKTGHSSMKIGPIKKTTVSVTLEKKLVKGKVQITKWATLTTRKVPFDLKVSISGQ